MVLAAYDKTGWSPRRGVMHLCKDGAHCGCAIGVLYGEAILNNDQIALETHEFVWAGHIFGHRYVTFFMSGFDDTGLPNHSDLEKQAYQDGQEVRKAVFQ